MNKEATQKRFFKERLNRWNLFSVFFCLVAGLMSVAVHAQDTAVIQGTVTDRTTGVPIAGVTVGVNCLPSRGCNSSVTTDANGNYSFTGSQLNNQGIGTLNFQGVGYYWNQQSYAIGSSTTTVNQTLLYGGTILQGTVTDADSGAGIVGALIQASDAYGYIYSTTGGQYTLDSSLTYEGSASYYATTAITLNVSAGAYFAISQSISPAPYPITANLQLIPANANVAVQGTVTDRTTGVPIAGVTVGVNCLPSRGCNSSVTTDANGNYSFTGSQLNNQGSGTLNFQGVGYYWNQQSYAIGSSTTTVNQTLLYGGTILQGTVTDADSGAGIVGALIQASDAYGYIYSTTGGQYTLDSSLTYEGSASYYATTAITLNVSAGAYFAISQSISPAPYPITANLQLIPANANVAVQGTVTDRTTGVPIAGVTVGVNCLPSRGCNSSVTTDANGNYSFTGSQLNNQGSGTLNFQGVGYYWNQQSYAIGSSTTTVNQTLLYGGTILQGTVTDADSGAGIVGALIQASDAYGYIYSTTGGQYTLDSSLTYEGSASYYATTAITLNVSAGAYFAISQSISPAPYPITANLQLIWTGLTSNVSVATAPSGLNITVDGVAAVAPQTYTWRPGNEHTISTSTPQAIPGGGAAPFTNWSDGGLISHVIVVPYISETITATFDGSAPTITPQVLGTIGANGWYTSNVSLSWTVSDPLAAVSSTSGCDNASITSDTKGQTFTCSATGPGGSGSQSVTIKRDATPPVANATATPLPNAAGWNNSAVTITFSGIDTVSGIASCSPPVFVTSQGANQTSPPGSCTDNAGNVSALVSVSGISIDETAPTVSDTISSSVPESSTGWYTAPVTISFAGTDPLSGVLPGSCTALIILLDGANQTVAGSCTNLAGISAPIVLTGINVDTIPPIASFTAAPPPNASGWNNTPVTVTFSGTDSVNGSGIASCTPLATLSTEGANQSATGTCSDVAGNTSTPTTDTVNIDVTPPAIALGNPSNGAGFPIGAAVNAIYSCSDALSGMAPSACIGTLPASAAINTAAAGPQSFSVTATNVAGNSTTTTSNYIISALSLTTPGSIWTYAGVDSKGFSGDAGQAINAQLENPRSVAADVQGNIYIADQNNSRIRKVATDGTM